MLDDDTIAVRLGKGRAARTLDGRAWDEFPAARAVVGAPVTRPSDRSAAHNASCGEVIAGRLARTAAS